MNQTTQMHPVNRLYKSRIFAMLYSDRKDLLDLYNDGRSPGGQAGD